ncbi:MAG: hypothetical protein OXJ52_06005 [Oligoflexia bacterium]|nr:hypothetical protein [Oligoflexia bacterium]
MSMFIKNNKAFSIMGTLVASAIGIIVITGLTKNFVHMNSQISQSEKKIQRATLIGLVGNAMNNPFQCKETLKHIASDIHSGNQPPSFHKIKTKTGTIVDLTPSHLQKYGMQGLAYFELKCDETSPVACDYSGASCSTPLTKKWILNLVSQSKVNNIPSCNRIMEISISITSTGSGADHLTCLGSSSPSPCDCVGGQIWDSSFQNCVCPSHRPNWNGSQCISCAGGQIWDSSSQTCVCPSGANWNGSSCVTCSTGQTWNSVSKTCVSTSSLCPTGYILTYPTLRCWNPISGIFL